MFDNFKQRTFIPQSQVKVRVPGLRDSAPEPEVKVYRAKPDGTPGELLRVEYPREKRRQFP